MTKKHSATPLLLLYGAVLVLAILFPTELPKHNAFLYLGFSVVLFFYTKSIRIYSITAIIISILSVFSILNGCGLMYIMIDSAIIFYLLSSISSISSLHFSKRVQTVISTVLFLLIIISVLNIFNPNAYQMFDGDIRYIGIFAGGNSSASMFALFSVFLWKMPVIQTKSLKIRKILIILFVCSLLFYFLACQTRTMLFFLPYWFYQMYKFFDKKVMLLSIIVLLSVSGTIYSFLQENARFEEDSSYLTRTGLYMAQISGILENYIIIPHGSNSAIEMINKFTGDVGFSTHNDFLRYVYDWGIVFFIIIFFIYKSIKKYLKFDVELFLIILGYSGFALHNLLFLPYVWIPFVLMLGIEIESKYATFINK